MSHDHPPAGGGPTADVSVRVAWADDAAAIAAVQVRAWPELYSGLLPAEVLPTDVDAVAAQAIHPALHLLPLRFGAGQGDAGGLDLGDAALPRPKATLAFQRMP